jgi:cell division protease FtsH
VTEDELREQLGRLVRQLTRDEDDGTTKVTDALRAHLGAGAAELPVLTEELQAWELPNLQLALEELLARDGWDAQILGLSAHARHYGLGLGDLVHGVAWGAAVGPPEYVNAAAGPGRTLACLAFAILLVGTPEGPLAVFVRRAQEHGHFGQVGLSIQAMASAEGVAPAFVAELKQAMFERDVYRGQMLTVTVDPMRGSAIAFVERPSVSADELVLPDGILATIERHVTGISRHRDVLSASGRHLSRGLLLWGPPGTGKTHTVRYLTSVRTDATVIVISGAALGVAGGFVTMARRLQPSMLVLEDVDLVAEERTYGPFGSNPVLFDLMNQMDGLSGDADIAFVLTTNRADALEPALAARPGRIDLAIELPLPDERGRRRLLELYARGLDLRLESIEPVVGRTAGVTASFLKELLRAAAVRAAEAGREQVLDEDVTAVLDRLEAEGAALTRVLLGGERPGAAHDPHGWMQVQPTQAPNAG